MEEETRREPLPFDENIVFRESSIFKKPNAPLSLPTPAEVREVARHSKNPRAELVTRPPPVTFPGLGLLVKYATEITLAEGQCLLFTRNTQVVHVPEVYGRCKDDDQVFIYMELVYGITLEKSWDTMTEGEKAPVCHQLHDMVDALRGVQHDSCPSFIGKLNFIVQRLSNLSARWCWQATAVRHHFNG